VGRAAAVRGRRGARDEARVGRRAGRRRADITCRRRFLSCSPLRAFVRLISTRSVRSVSPSLLALVLGRSRQQKTEYAVFCRVCHVMSYASRRRCLYITTVCGTRRID
jgi:hypothetical protein